MSAFLFYKPNSNPGRFSRKERFSQRLPVSPTLDGLSNGKAETSTNIPATSVSRSPIRPHNDFDTELSKWPPSSAYMANTLAQDMRERRCGSTTQDDDRDSLHSLFSKSRTGCGSGAMGLTDQNARNQEAIPEFSRPNDTPSCFSPGEIFATDQCAFSMMLDGRDTPGQPCSNQQEFDEREPHSIIVQPVRQTSQSAPSSTCYGAISPDSAPSSPGASPRSCTFTNHVQTMEIDADVQEHSASSGEADPLDNVDMQSVSGDGGETQIDTSNPKADSHLEGRIGASLNNMMYSQNTAECSMKTANLEIGIEHLRSEAQSLPSRRDLVPARSRSCDSLRPADVTALTERRPDVDSCHPDPCSTTTQETHNGFQPSVLPIDEAKSALIPATNSASTSSQPDVDMEIERASQACPNATNSPREEPEATTSHGYNSENSEASSGRRVTHQADNAVSTPSTPRSTPITRTQRTSLSVSPSPAQPRRMKFSHVEIRNAQHTKPRDKSVEVTNEKRSDQLHCTSRADGPWRLDGTTLSVDIREVERIPVLVGYSTYRVVGGQLIQSITLAQGNTGLPIPGKPTREENNWHSYGINTGKKTSSRGPLSLEQKRDLVRLREEGYSWNEITSMFPGRKKGSLQGIYYSKLRNTHSRTSQTNQHRRRLSSDSPHITHPYRTTDVSVNTRAQPAKARQHPRYSFRARPVA